MKVDKEQLTYDLLMIEFFTNELELIKNEIEQYPIHHRKPASYANQILVNQLHLSIHTQNVNKVAYNKPLR